MSDDPLMFDDDEDFGGEEPPKKPSLAEIWNNNPSLKLFTVVAVVGLGIVGFLMFGGGSGSDTISTVGSGSAVNQTVGTSELTEEYREAIKEEDDQRLDEASNRGGSFLPTPTSTPKRIEAPVDLEGNSINGWAGDGAVTGGLGRVRGGKGGIDETGCRGDFLRLIAQFPDDLQTKYKKMLLEMTPEEICKMYDHIKNMSPDELRRFLDKMAAMSAEERRKFLEGLSEEEVCQKGMQEILSQFSASLQSRYRRMMREMTPEEICKLYNQLKDLSPDEQRKLLSILSNLSPDERRKLLDALSNLSAEDKAKLINTLNGLSREEQKKLINAMSGMTAAEQAALVDLLDQMSPEERKKLVNALASLSEADRKKLIGALSRLSPAERSQLLEALSNMSPAEMARLVNAVARLGSAALSQLQQNQLSTNSGPSLGALDVTVLSPEQIQQMSQQFSQQMGQILQSNTPQPSKVQGTGVIRPFSLPQLDRRQALSYIPANQSASLSSNSRTSSSSTSTQASAAFQTSASGGSNRVSRFSNTGFANYGSVDDDINGIMYNAGDIAYAQIINQANSDVPGPVLAYIASGPLAGARALGSFSTAEEHLIVQFNLAVKDKKEYEINAIALDPQTTLPAVASDVDHHYFTKVLLPAAATFVEGFAAAVVQQGTSVSVEGETVTTSQDDLDLQDELLAGFEEAAGQLSDVLDENADRPVTITINPGTRIGVLFLEKVLNQAVE